MWIAGVTEGLMWRAVNDDGTLTYSFVESLQAVEPYHLFRLLGGLLYISGMFIMVYNVWKTVASGKSGPVAVLEPA
jgi:cytochrome c oxidase cbb3-type subunit 1